MTSDGNLVRFETRSTQAQSLPQAQSVQGWLNFISSSAILLSWLYLNGSALQWVTHFFYSLSRFNLVFVMGGALLVLVQVWRYRKTLTFSTDLKFQRLPLLLMVGTAIAAILCRWWLDLEQLPIVCFILGTYGLIGLFLQSSVWQRGIPFIGAIAILIPFAVQFTTGLGFPARSLTAEIVELILKSIHISAISSENILVLDTGIAFVDLPCSGLKSIWTGSLFLLAATLLEGRQMGVRWFLVCLVNLALLIVANVARILTLVVLTFVMKQAAIAATIHVPLGILSFITVCLMTWGLLRFVPRHGSHSKLPPIESAKIQNPTSKIRNVVLTIGLLIGLASLPQPIAIATTPTALHPLHWQAPMQTETIELNPYEQAFFADYPGVVTQKQKFQFKGISGSMIFVTSPTWQAHHAPELCLTGSGFKVDHMEKQSLSKQVTGRWLSLNQGQLAAAYWFQSPQRTTDHYLDRIWSEITRQEAEWTMVSILFDQPVSPEDAALQGLVDLVHDTIATAM